MNIKKFKKSQLSIFIVIAIIIILFTIFLIMSSNTQENNEIKNLEEESQRLDFNIYNFYESSQTCLDKSTKKALLLASLRGGIIYPNENTQQFLGSLNSLNLSPDYVNNLNLDISSIQEHMLPSLSSKNYISLITKNKIINELKHYITRDFVVCQTQSLNSTNFKNLSYTVINPETIKNENENKFSYKVDELKANNGTKILLYRDNGEIINAKYNSFEQKIITNHSFNQNENVIGIIKDDFSIEITLEKTIVNSKIITSDSFKSSTNEIDRGDISIEIETPFYSLFQDLQALMNEKMFNRSFSFNNSEQISNLRLNNNLNVTISNIENNNEEIFQTIVISQNNLNENFQFDSFVGSYKNSQPILEKDSFQLFTSSTTNLVEDSAFLENKINHNEYEDNFLHQNRFEPYEDSEVKLYPNGTLDILTNNGFFSKQFYVTDGELSTPFTIDFNLGGVLNEKNSQFDRCFDVTYNLGSLNSGYDEFNSFISNSIRELDLKRIKPATNYEWFGVVSTGTSNSVEVIISENPSCFDTNNFNLALPYSFTLSQTNPTRSISIENYHMNGSINGEPFVVNIGAVDCLGPNPIPTNSGLGTCCNTQSLNNLWESANEAANFNSIFSNNFISPAGTVGYEFDEMYMCPQTPRASNFSHWSDTSFLKTQELKTTTQVICEGESPILEDNDATTSGSISVGDFTPLDFPTNNVEVNFEPSGDFYNVCQECRVLEQNEAFVLTGSLGELSIGTEVISQDAQDGIYLEEDKTIRRLQGGVCYDVFQERECQSGAPAWVDKSQTPVILNTYTNTITDSNGCSINKTYRENCVGGGNSLISTSSSYNCP